jgi:hypothetical protein
MRLPVAKGEHGSASESKVINLVLVDVSHTSGLAANIASTSFSAPIRLDQPEKMSAHFLFLIVTKQVEQHA